MRVTQISICNVYGDRNLFCYVFGLTHTRLTLIKATKAVAAMQRLFCWRKLASCEGKVTRNEFRDVSCRRRFNAEKRVIRYQSSEVRLRI